MLQGPAVTRCTALSCESKCYFCHSTLSAASETLSSSAGHSVSCVAAAPSGREEVVDAGAMDVDEEDDMLVADELADEEPASTVVLLGAGISVRVTVVEVVPAVRVLRPARVSDAVEPGGTPLNTVKVGSCGLLCRATSASPAAWAECAWQMSRHTASQKMLRRSMLGGADMAVVGGAGGSGLEAAGPTTAPQEVQHERRFGVSFAAGQWCALQHWRDD